MLRFSTIAVLAVLAAATAARAGLLDNGSHFGLDSRLDLYKAALAAEAAKSRG